MYTQLNKQWVKVEITIEIRKYTEINKNQNSTFQNVWGEAKAMLIGKSIDLNS